MKSSNELLKLLIQHQLIKQADLNDSQQMSSAWYIKVLMGICGWLAACFILGFIALGISFLFDSPLSMGVFGVVMVAVSFYLLSSSQAEFIEHLAIAVSYAGQALITFALFSNGHSNELFVWVVLTVMCCLLAFIMPSYIHQMMSAYFSTLCLYYVLHLAQLATIFSSIVLFFVALMWLYEFTFSHQVRKLQAVAYGAVIGLIQFKTSILFAGHGQTWMQEQLPNLNQWADEGLNLVVLMFVLYQLVKHKKINLPASQKWLGIAVLMLLGVGSFFANGIVSALVIIILGFAISNKILLVLGIIASLINLSAYYYLLDITLLNKSFVLAGLGSASLVLAYFSKQISRQSIQHEN